VDESEAALPPPSLPTAAIDDAAVALPRWVALFQALMVCGVPTQLVLTVLLTRVVHMTLDPDNISLQFFATLSLIDTAVVVVLIRTFLWQSREQATDVFVGVRPIRGEVVRGLAFVPVVFFAVAGVVLGLRAVAPRMHTVELNPYETFLRSPAHAAVFLVVVVIAGGVREELQRAFILRRFQQRLGGVGVGLAVSSVAFGALHVVQGWDVAAAIGLLGLLWGILYVSRRSVVMPMVNHAGFDAIQVLQGFVVKSLGG